MVNWKIGQRVEAAARPLGEARSPIARRRWALVNVAATREITTAERIDDLGYLTYVPRFQTEVWNRRKHRKREIVLRPLFPGYLFTQCDISEDPWGSIERVPGVVRVVRIGDQPSYVPPDLVAGLQAAESTGHAERRAALVDEFKPGERLRVTDGPFQGSTALFIEALPRLDGGGRIAALLDLLGRKVRIKLDADQVARD